MTARPVVFNISTVVCALLSVLNDHIIFITCSKFVLYA